MRDNFQPSIVGTSLGPVRLWSLKAPPNPARPLVFVIPGMLTDFETPLSIVNGLGILADGCVLELPNSADRALSSCRLDDLSRLVGEILEGHFADRRVMVVGASTGAVIALGVRARNLVRVVAIEPYLGTGEIWPVTGPLRERLREGGLDAAAQRFIWEAFGVGPDRSEARSHRAMLEGLAVPLEVVFGDVALHPRRDLERFPSLADEADRRWLAALPGVKLHSVEAGHNVVGNAFKPVMAIVCEAARRSGAATPANVLRLDEPLRDATPVTADRVLYRGAHGADFADALRRRNPRQDVVWDLAAEPADGVFDAVVLDAAPSDEEFQALVRRIRKGGWLIARWRVVDEALQAQLSRAGLAPGDPIDEAGTAVIRAQRTDGEARAPAIVVKMLALADMMMDIRTRLPTQGLASDPAVVSLFSPSPFVLPKLPTETPKVVVVQRPYGTPFESWRKMREMAERLGWLLVLEFDDYPPLIDEVKGRPPDYGFLKAFGYLDAVQTSTDVLEGLFRPFNPEIVVFPNAAFDLPPFPAGPRPRRVFYGAMIRGSYAVKVAASLSSAIERFPDTEFVVIGDRDVFGALPTDRKEYHEYMSFESYLEVMASCSISLSPIEALRYRDTKSDAKYVDASRGGALTIASPTIYDRTIRHGVNGLLAPDVDDWPRLLIQALSDDAGRERMARAAWEDVRDNRMFAYQVPLRREWYRDLWARRREVRAAVYARAPELTAS